MAPLSHRCEPCPQLCACSPPACSLGRWSEDSYPAQLIQGRRVLQTDLNPRSISLLLLRSFRMTSSTCLPQTIAALKCKPEDACIWVLSYMLASSPWYASDGPRCGHAPSPAGSNVGIHGLYTVIENKLEKKIENEMETTIEGLGSTYAAGHHLRYDPTPCARNRLQSV